AKAAGDPTWQPRADPKEVIPIKSGLLFLVTTRGPPESPRQVLLPLAPLVQMLESWISRGNEDLHTALVITGRLTWLRAWLLEMLPLSLVRPKPEARAVSPAKFSLIWLPLGKAMMAMVFEVPTLVPNLITATSLRMRLGVQLPCMTTLDVAILVPPENNVVEPRTTVNLQAWFWPSNQQ
ncbi:hypothetical protein P5E35_14505, partial [Clostridium perfringens]|nr:hypothetical protein [Clostridium perfringens]